MSATITVRESVDGNPVHANTACHIDVVGTLATTPLYTAERITPAVAGGNTDPNVAGGLYGDNGPRTAPLKYHIKIDAPAGTDDAVSPTFTPSSDYKYTWDNYIFPAAGSYTISVVEEAGGTDVITQAVTVD